MLFDSSSAADGFLGARALRAVMGTPTLAQGYRDYGLWHGSVVFML